MDTRAEIYFSSLIDLKAFSLWPRGPGTRSGCLYTSVTLPRGQEGRDLCCSLEPGLKFIEELLAWIIESLNGLLCEAVEFLDTFINKLDFYWSRIIGHSPAYGKDRKQISSRDHLWWS